MNRSTRRIRRLKLTRGTRRDGHCAVPGCWQRRQVEAAATPDAPAGRSRASPRARPSAERAAPRARAWRRRASAGSRGARRSTPPGQLSPPDAALTAHVGRQPRSRGRRIEQRHDAQRSRSGGQRGNHVSRHGLNAAGRAELGREHDDRLRRHRRHTMEGAGASRASIRCVVSVGTRTLFRKCRSTSR